MFTVFFVTRDNSSRDSCGTDLRSASMLRRFSGGVGNCLFLPSVISAIKIQKSFISTSKMAGSPIKNVTIVGSGLMGAGIAQVSLGVYFDLS